MANPRCATTTPPAGCTNLPKWGHRSELIHRDRRCKRVPWGMLLPRGRRATTCRVCATRWEQSEDRTRTQGEPWDEPEVWLDPTDLTVSVILEQSSRLSSNSNKLESFASGFTSIGRRHAQVRRNPTLYSCVRCLRRGARMRVWPPHYPKVMRGDEAHQVPNLRCWHAQNRSSGRDCFTSGSQDGSWG